MYSGACPESSGLDVSARFAAGVPEDAARAALSAMEPEDVAACPHCRSAALHRWGTGRKSVRRWRCRDCQRSFSATTGTILAGLHAPKKFASVLIDMLSDEPSSCRGLAAKLNVSRMTAWAWRRRINAAYASCLENNGEQASAGFVDAGTLVVRDSRKASREWVDHRREPTIYPKPDRLRWVDYDRLQLPLPSPMSRYLVPVTLLWSQADGCRGIVAPTSTKVPVNNGIANVEAWQPQPEMCLDVEEARLAEPASSTSGLFNEATAEKSTSEPMSDAACRNRLLDGLRQFLKPFRGPATKYLIGYVAWFIARLTANDNVHRHLVLQRLWAPLGPRWSVRLPRMSVIQPAI